MGKWTSTAGPIQTKRVSAAMSSLRWEGNTFTRITGTVGDPASERRHSLTNLFAGADRTAEAADAIGERFAWTITAANHREVIAAFEAATAEARATRPAGVAS